MRYAARTDAPGTYLGKLCRRNHDHQGSGMTLRDSRGHCPECVKVALRERMAANPEKAAAVAERQRIRDAARRPPKGRPKMPEEERLRRMAEQKRARRARDAEAVRALQRYYYYRNSLRISLRNRVNTALKQQCIKKAARISKYGIDLEAILAHLGPCPGPRAEWHIDHIKPLARFDLSDPAQLLEAFSPKNHQWLPAKENLKKNAKYDQASCAN